MKKNDVMIKKNDILLILMLFIIAIVGFIAFRMYNKINTKSPEVVVSIDGKEYGRYPLTKEMEEKITISDTAYNVFVITEGKVNMIDASCPDHICVKHHKISQQNESIVCLPNKVVIQIENGEDEQIDGFTH